MTVPGQTASAVPARIYRTLDQFLDAPEHPSGLHTIMEGGLPIEVRYEDRGSPHTLVLFHAAITKATMRLPIFSGAAFSEPIAANRIFISDPSLRIDSRLKLAWFAGSRRQPELQNTLTAIIARLCSPASPPVLFGASGGGFAAMYYAWRLPGALAVPVNPQTDLSRYTPAIVLRYRSIAWDGASLADTGVTTDLVRLYAEGSDAHVLYVQNTGDSSHMQDHFTPFMAALPADHRITPLLLDVGPGHVPPARDKLTEILKKAFAEHIVRV